MFPRTPLKAKSVAGLKNTDLALIFPVLVLLVIGPTQATFAQTYTWSTIAGLGGVSGTDDGVGSKARFNAPWGIAVDGSGTSYIVDSGNQLIRMLALVGTNWNITTIAGSVAAWHDVDGTNSQANFLQPYGIAADSSSPTTLYITDQKVNTAGAVRSLRYLGAGIWQSATLVDYFAGGAVAQPTGLALDSAGELFVTLTEQNSVIYVSQPGANWVYSTIAGGGFSHPGTTDGTNLVAFFNGPAATAVDASGNVYVADTENHTIRKLALLSGTANWVTTTIAGTPGISGNADGMNGAALFNGPDGLAVDSSGHIFVADANNNTIRKVTPQGTNWIATTIGGQLNRSHGTNDGVGAASSFYHPAGLAVDNLGRVFVADYQNNTIRMGIPSAITNPPPALQMATAGNSAYVMWPYSDTGYVLQYSTNLNSGPWVTVAGGISTNLVFTGLMTDRQTFYRLLQP